MLFDGKLRVYSQCAGCKDLMIATTEYQNYHPACWRETPYDILSRDYINAIESDDVESEQRLYEKIENWSDLSVDKYAIFYASIGWPVFPLKPGTKIPATRNGVKDATVNPSIVMKMFKPNSKYNIGIATGHMFDVMDIDPANGGRETFLRLLSTNKIKPPHAVCVTRSSGLHLYYPTSVNARNGSNVFGLKGIDYRARGGYVVAPPSIVDGSKYSFVVYPSPKIRNVNVAQKFQK